MSGEIIGTDGIGTDSHACQAVALEDTEVCALPFKRIEALGRRERDLPAQLCTGCCRGRSPASAR